MSTKAGGLQLELGLEVVLTEQHGLYSPQKPGEAYCYRHGLIRFSAVGEAQWKRVLMRPKPPGEVDFGNVDYLYAEADRYFLGGSWGDVEVVSAERPAIELS